MKTYFDQDPDDTSDETAEGSDYIADVEHSVALSSNRGENVWHTIEEEEYNAGDYIYYVYAHPYLSAAFQAPGLHDGLAVGRLHFGPGQATKTKAGGTGVTLPAGVDPDDDVIVFEAKIANSVVQYIVDEMNANRSSGFVMRHRDMIDDPTIFEVLQRPWSTADAYYRFHTASGWKSNIPGGQWDHKPKIGPVWGAWNRLGNSGNIYYYDYWSNIHYGFIMGLSGYSEGATLFASTVEQFTDWGSTDSRFDQEPMSAGWRLSGVVGNNPFGRDITRDDIKVILDRHPHWERAPRRAAENAPPPPTPLQQIETEWNRFNNLSPVDQADFLRRMFGG